MDFDALYPAVGIRPTVREGRPKRIHTPLAEPTQGRKNTPAYNAHSYPTKVPPEAIEPFIERHTKPGHMVLDPFCGSGMTGLAALRLGRTPVLNDLSYGAAHLAWNMTTPCSPERLQIAAAAILEAVSGDYDRWYRARGPNGEDGTLVWTLYSQVLACPSCEAPSAIWEDGTDQVKGTVAESWPCGECGGLINKRGARVLDSSPAWVAVESENGRSYRAPSEADLQLIEEIASEPVRDWVPRIPMGPDREMYVRCALQLHGITEVADFWTPRNLRAVARLWAEITAWPDERERQALAFAFTNTAWHGTRMRRFNARGGHRPLTGTLYVPQLSIEVNPGPVFKHKVRQLARFYEEFPDEVSRSFVSRASATALPLADQSVEYCFTDPPFGSNIFYADCAVVWESWLGGETPLLEEAVVNRSLKSEAGGKSIDDYAGLIEASFREIERVLKPTAWATVVFNSSDAEVWAAVRTAVEHAGFDLANASYLDKTQQSHKGYKGRSGSEDVTSFDIVLNLHKPGTGRRRQKPARAFDNAAAVLGAHLASLPTIGEDDGADRERTLPFLHSLLVREHFNGTIGLEVGQYALVRRICESHFDVDAEGRWSVRESRSTT